MQFSNYSKLIIILIAIIFLTSAIYIFYPVLSGERTIVAFAEKKDISQSIIVNGMIEPKNKQEIIIEKGTIIKNLYVEENTIVEKGTLLFELDKNDLSMRIKEKELELLDTEAALEKIVSSNLERENEEKEIALKELELNIKEKSKKIEEIEENYNSFKVMYEKGYISKKELDAEQHNYESTLAEVELLKRRYEIEKEKIEELKESNEMDRKQKINSLSKKIELLRIQLDYLNKQKNEINTSSINGKIVNLDIYSGEKVDTEGPHVTICDLSEIYVVSLVEQKYVPYIKIGDNAEISIPGLDKKVYGKVYSIDEIVTDKDIIGNPSVRIKVKIDKPNDNIKVGFRADVKLLFNTKSNVVTVDYRAVFTDNRDNEFVYIVKDGIAEKTYVETGVKNDFEVEITKGIIKGDQYIVNPSEDMRSKNSFRLWRYDFK